MNDIRSGYVLIMQKGKLFEIIELLNIDLDYRNCKLRVN